jgi:hypothetical protein
LSLQLGVEVSEIKEGFEAFFKEVDEAKLKPGYIGVEGSYYLLDPTPNYAVKAVNKLLDEGFTVCRSIDELTRTDRVFKPGTFVIKKEEGLEKKLTEFTEELGLDFIGIDTSIDEVFELSVPKVGVYRAWLPNADEGWLRMVLDEYGFHYENLYPEDIRAGDWKDRVNVLVIPDLTRDVMIDGMRGQTWLNPSKYEYKYTQGVGEKGNKEILGFLKRGGTIVTINKSNEYAVKDLWAEVELPLEGINEKEFYCPGSLLRVLVDNTHPVGYGFDREETVMFLHSPVFNVLNGESIARYPESDPLISGWVLGEKYLRGFSAAAEIPAGDGVILMIGFPPHFRNQNRATFKFLFNALYYGAA